MRPRAWGSTNETSRDRRSRGAAHPARALAAVRPRARLAPRPDRVAARRPRGAVAARAGRAADLRIQLRQLPHVHRRAAVLAHLRAHGAHVDHRDGVHVVDRLSNRVVHRQDRARTSQVGAARPVSDSVLGQRDGTHARVDDPAARIGGCAAVSRRAGNHRATGGNALPRRDDPGRTGVHIAAVHGRAVGQCAGESRRRPDRGGVRPGRQRVVDSAPDRDSPRCAGDRRGLDRRVHAHTRQLSDADAARRQELAVVHRADLRPVHHPLQLGAGRGVRLSAVDTLYRHRLAGPRTDRPALRRRDAPHMIHSLPRSVFARAGFASYVTCFFIFLFLPLVVVAVFAFNDANYPAPPLLVFTIDWFTGGAGRVGLFADPLLLASLGASAIVAVWVTLLSVAVGAA